jgi:hypothetical protein
LATQVEIWKNVSKPQGRLLQCRTKSKEEKKRKEKKRKEKKEKKRKEKKRREKKRTLSIVPDYVECVCGSGELSVVFY